MERSEETFTKVGAVADYDDGGDDDDDDDDDDSNSEDGDDEYHGS